MCQKMCRHYSTQQKNYPIKNLLLRNNIFYYRYRIYVNGVAKDKRISLHTRDYIEAVGTMLDIERETIGLVRINAKDCLGINVNATKITYGGSTGTIITESDFLTAPDETAIVKYDYILQSIIQIINN